MKMETERKSVKTKKKKSPTEITYFHRESHQFEKEKIYGEGMLKWLYETGTGQMMSRILARPSFSKFYGFYQDSSLSKKKIKNFINEFSIDMDEFLPSAGRNFPDPYASFNEFFIRKFKEGKRAFVKDENLMPAFAEARYLAYEKVTKEQTFPVKGEDLSAASILQKREWTKAFEGGPLFIARLCPVDYHRFHFPDDGRVLDHYQIKGDLHSVNPVALKYKSNILCTNERYVTILETKNFGKLAFVEVGAICVGKIVQSHNLKDSFKRGEEKGLFLFGGSTVILMGIPGSWVPDNDLLQRTAENMETFVKLGQGIAHK